MPRGPVRPNRQREILTGALLGLVLAFGASFFLEYLDNTLKTPDDVRVHLGAPLLGVVPETGQAPADLLLQRNSTQSTFSEAYRVIRTSLNYSWPDASPRIIVVTST